ncbi:hypothetical protein CY0110_16997 [Crocosphaera chwakensis CCY0110]|uniref:Uncharacterized protein n=1 Tax=Crocosphaera chwakensis CCY0110 TaxID=391612 RepID=A3II81_9CHRO|nr:hypothetical protein CY0110_16997 [Crocosphaera chwakensis CCY0110]
MLGESYPSTGISATKLITILKRFTSYSPSCFCGNSL